MKLIALHPYARHWHRPCDLAGVRDDQDLREPCRIAFGKPASRWKAPSVNGSADRPHARISEFRIFSGGSGCNLNRRVGASAGDAERIPTPATVSQNCTCVERADFGEQWSLMVCSDG